MPGRVFDLVLYSPEADEGVRAIRQAEIGHSVDVMIFGQTEFLFKDGGPKPVISDPRNANANARVRDHIISAAAPELLQCNASSVAPHRDVYSSHKQFRKPPGSFCRESYARNALGEAFFNAGGTEEDWALISDADEIPRATAIDTIRRDYQELLRLPSIIRFGAVHNFKYGVRCERVDLGSKGLRWTKGPIAVSGRTLRQYGAQRLRTEEGCVPVGFSASCRSSAKPSNELRHFGRSLVLQIIHRMPCAIV